MPTAFITGLRGFTGKYLAQELRAAGYHISGTVHGEAIENAEEFAVDLCDLNAIRKVIARVQPDVVAHLAAISFVAHGDVDAIYRTNVMGTRNLLQALAEQEKRPECILLASSANIYGNSVEGLLAETTLPNPANDYAVSKLAMEYMARLWLDKLPIVIVRPFNYTGVGQTLNFLLSKIVDHFRRRAEVIELGNLNIWRDFSDVRTVVNIYRRLIELAPAGETFNICSGTAASLGEVLDMMKRIAGYQIQVTVNPAFVRANEVKMLCGDSSKLRGLIGQWETPTLEETLRWMIDKRT
ncbi:MAG: GDP-mannose 4,6-dehydratase [Deltaproteobacteria bacterium]|nr:GDP-mannose 4,6-dehydratase [Deltaproteobacteria bacterium]